MDPGLLPSSSVDGAGNSHFSLKSGWPNCLWRKREKELCPREELIAKRDLREKNRGTERRERLFDSTGTTEIDDAKRHERECSQNCETNLGKTAGLTKCKVCIGCKSTSLTQILVYSLLLYIKKCKKKA